MAPRYTVNGINGTFAHHWTRVTINMDVVCQEIISFINQAEVAKLAAVQNVGYASFGGAVIDPPNGQIVADGWLNKIEIVAFSQKTRRPGWSGVRRWDADITVAYSGTTVLTQEDVGQESRPARDMNALADLRQQFRTKYGV